MYGDNRAVNRVSVGKCTVSQQDGVLGVSGAVYKGSAGESIGGQQGRG